MGGDASECRRRPGPIDPHGSLPTFRYRLMQLKHDRYLVHEEFTAALRELAAAFPSLARLAAIGRSFLGREIWAVTLTNQATGAHDRKPGFYIDGNNHGEEVITSAVTLYTIDFLLSEYGRDPDVTRLLDTRAVYVLPRVNPDGAELCLTTPYRTVGTGRYHPADEYPTGLHLEDVDGDGEIRQMAIPDSRGEWKRSAREPRLLVQRQPWEAGGQYYRMLPEGILRDWDGVTFPIVPPRHGNLNRQFPVNWEPEGGEYGSGDFPLNESEAMAMARFVLSRPNITGAQAYHSHGGLILRPSGFKRDSELPAADLEIFKALGAIGTEITEYPVISTYEDFTPNLRNPRHGVFSDWLYDRFGIPALSSEVWDSETVVGISKPQYFSTRPHTESEQIRFLQWADVHSPRAHQDWHEFAHPQLGTVLLGGWDPFYIHRNPPPKLIGQVAQPNALFTVRHALASPLLRLRDVTSQQVGSDLYIVRARVENQGYLATHLTQQARLLDKDGDVEVSLELDAGCDLLMGQSVVEIGDLAGREERRMPYDPWRRPWGESAAQAEWLVRGPGDARVGVHVRSRRAGSCSSYVSLHALPDS